MACYWVCRMSYCVFFVRRFYIRNHQNYIRIDNSLQAVELSGHQTPNIGVYNPSLDHLMITTDTLILGDFNAHHSSWYSSFTESRGTMLESMMSGSNFGILNWDSPTRFPGNANPSSLYVSLASASLITSTN